MYHDEQKKQTKKVVYPVEMYRNFTWVQGEVNRLLFVSTATKIRTYTPGEHKKDTQKIAEQLPMYCYYGMQRK